MELAPACPGRLPFYIGVCTGRTRLPPGIHFAQPGRRRQAAQAAVGAAGLAPKHPQENMSYLFKNKIDVPASAWSGTWAVAKKDLLTFKRDTREWFGILIPYIIMAFFIGQYFMAPSTSSRSSMIMVLINVYHHF